MSGAETARRRVVQRRIGGAETAAPKCPSPLSGAPHFNKGQFGVDSPLLRFDHLRFLFVYLPRRSLQNLKANIQEIADITAMR